MGTEVPDPKLDIADMNTEREFLLSKHLKLLPNVLTHLLNI